MADEVVSTRERERERERDGDTGQQVHCGWLAVSAECLRVLSGPPEWHSQQVTSVVVAAAAAANEHGPRVNWPFISGHW